MARPFSPAVLAAWLAAGCAGPPAPPAPTVLGAPPAASGGTSCGSAALPEQALRRLNAARAAARSCGGQRMAAVPALAWNPVLLGAARQHSADMARHNFFSHSGRNGSRVNDRVSAQGYAWQAVGENIAGGDRSVEAVMDGWLASPGHCRNIMGPAFAEAALACVEQPGTQWERYWTLVLAKRKG